MTHRGYIAHELPHRVRIKVDADDADSASFDRLVAELRALPGVTAAWASPRARSVTVCGDARDGPIRGALERAKVFEFRRPARRRLERLRERLAMGGLDEALAIGLSGLGLYQLTRGEVTGPASENFWLAFRAHGHLRRRGMAVGLVLLGILQIARGQYLSSAPALFSYALTLQHLARERLEGPRRSPRRAPARRPQRGRGEARPAH